MWAKVSPEGEGKSELVRPCRLAHRRTAGQASRGTVAASFDVIVRGWNVAPSLLPGRLEIGDGKLRLLTP
jgi:hypothetical protein